MIKRIIGEVKPYRILILTLLIVSTGILILQDYSRLTKDFSKLMSFLTKVRLKAMQNDVILITQFMGKNVIVKNGKTGNVLDSLHVSTLNKINYDTKLGKNMIVFSGRGTSPYNIRIHGGDMTLKSWFGFRKNIAVNCTGLVTECLYPEDLAILEENSD
ncbi:MAG: hypothetical protein H8E80_04770 [Desulfobacteraceae bacterium]|uniref:Uncharacterized protein n=1 Tax=Candidatus Desulfaltia bathyphila TaxID=2841697 RepID=A0A8J6N374_9BACT|nr:hypothetical protein [Candidatus Desulfaltia bathyphila]